MPLASPNLRRLREEAGIPGSRLAETVGVTPSHLTHVERQRCPASGALFGRLATALGVHMGQLIDEPQDWVPEVMTVGQLSSYLQIPVSTLYQWRHVGYGPAAAKVGRWLRYRKPVVDQWLSEQE